MPSASSRSPARGRRGPLLGVARQAALDLGLALGQHAAALGQAGHAHLELLALRPRRAPSALRQLLPGRQRLVELGQRRRPGAPLGRRPRPAAARPSAAGAAGPRQLARPAGAAPRRCGSRSASAPCSRAEAWRSTRPLGRGAGVAGRGQRDRGARPGAARAGVGGGGGLGSARACASSTAAAVTTLVAERTRQPVAAKRSPSGVTTTRSSRARERSMASSQPSTRTARPTSASSTDSADGLAVRGPARGARTGCGAAARPAGRRRRRRAGGPVARASTAPVTPALAQGGQGRPGPSGARRPPRRPRRRRRRPRRRPPSRRRSRPGRAASRPRRRRSRSSSRPPAPCRSRSARSSASARAAVRWRSCSASSARLLRPPPAPRGGLVELGAAARPASASSRPAACSSSAGRSASRSASHRGRGVALLEGGHAGRRARPGPAARGRRRRPSELDAGRGPRASASSGVVVAQHRRPSAPAASASSRVERGQRRRRASARLGCRRQRPPRPRRLRARWPAGPPRPRGWRPRRRRRRHRARPRRPGRRSRSTPASPGPARPAPATRPRARARSSSRRDDSSAGGRGRPRRRARSSGAVQLALLVAGRRPGAGPPCRRGAGRARPARRRPGSAGPPAARSATRVVRAGRGGLALEGPDLAPHLAHQVAQALEVLRGGGQPALGPLAAPAVLEHPGRLLDDGPAVLGAGVEHGVELALADDHVLLAAHARVGEQLLDVEQPAGRPVDGVLAVARAEQGPGDGDLGQVDGQLARRVVDGQRHLGPPERRADGRARRR